MVSTRTMQDADGLSTSSWGKESNGTARKSLRRTADGIVAWRRVAIDRIAERCASAPSFCRDKDLYEFGVYTGRSMRGIVRALAAANVSYSHFWGFDSFQGLPKESTKASMTSLEYGALVKQQWRTGTYNAADALDTHSYAELTDKIAQYIGDARVQWVRGYYEHSLTSRLAKEKGMRPALYVDLDCDLYSSTELALDFLARHRLLVAGTILGYDDWTTGGPGGQQRAHAEVAAKYGIVLRMLRPPAMFGHVREPCFEIESIGHATLWFAVARGALAFAGRRWAERLGWFTDTAVHAMRSLHLLADPQRTQPQTQWKEHPKQSLVVDTKRSRDAKQKVPPRIKGDAHRTHYRNITRRHTHRPRNASSLPSSHQEARRRRHAENKWVTAALMRQGCPPGADIESFEECKAALPHLNGSRGIYPRAQNKRHYQYGCKLHHTAAASYTCICCMYSDGKS